MFSVHKFERQEYTLIILEGIDFQPTDLIKLPQFYPEVDGSKGVGIAATPEVPTTVVGDLFSHYRNRSVWQGGYEAKLHGILVGQSFEPASNPNRQVKSDVVECRLPCLECHRKGKEELVRLGALRPYCSAHTEKSPHRRKHRGRKRG